MKQICSILFGLCSLYGVIATSPPATAPLGTLSSLSSFYLDDYSLGTFETIFQIYVTNVAPVCRTLNNAITTQVALFKKMTSVGVIFDWPAMLEICIPLYTVIQNQSAIQVSALNSLSGTQSVNGLSLVLSPSDMSTLLGVIEKVGSGAAAAIQAFNQFIAALKELKVNADIDITEYILEMPVSISNQIEQSIGAVAAANGQIGNALAGMSTKNVASIVAAQDNTQASSFITAMFTYANTASSTINQIATVWKSSSMMLVAGSKIHKKKPIFLVHAKLLVQLIESVGLELAPLYGDIGAALLTFQKSFIPLV